MDSYRDLDSPGHLLGDFELLNDCHVAIPLNDSFNWPQSEEVGSWSGPLSPPSATYVNEQRSSTPYAPVSLQPQQQQPVNFLISESGSSFTEAFVASLPERNELIDVSETFESAQPTSFGTAAQPSKSVSNALESDLIDLNLVLDESSFDLTELDQYLNTADDSVENSQPESIFGSIIREDQYQNLFAVNVDHGYGTPSTSSQLDSVELVCSTHIFKAEFFAEI